MGSKLISFSCLKHSPQLHCPILCTLRCSEILKKNNSNSFLTLFTFSTWALSHESGFFHPPSVIATSRAPKLQLQKRARFLSFFPACPRDRCRLQRCHHEAPHARSGLGSLTRHRVAERGQEGNQKQQQQQPRLLLIFLYTNFNARFLRRLT